MCKSSVTNDFNLESNNIIDGDDMVRVGELNIIQSTSQFANCVFSDDVKNTIANTIATEITGKTENVNSTKSDNVQKSETESKGVGGIFKSILDGIGGIISSSMGLFIIVGILGVVFLLYMAKGGGNDLARDFKKPF